MRLLILDGDSFRLCPLTSCPVSVTWRNGCRYMAVLQRAISSVLDMASCTWPEEQLGREYDAAEGELRHVQAASASAARASVASCRYNDTRHYRSARHSLCSLCRPDTAPGALYRRTHASRLVLQEFHAHSFVFPRVSGSIIRNIRKDGAKVYLQKEKFYVCTWQNARFLETGSISLLIKKLFTFKVGAGARPSPKYAFAGSVFTGRQHGMLRRCHVLPSVCMDDAHCCIVSKRRKLRSNQINSNQIWISRAHLQCL